ncbi:MAG: hypothetical protein ACN6OK_10190 [Alcaligenes faecalis]
MTKRVQSLNAAGIEMFAAWLRDPKGAAPTEILDDQSYCEEIVQEFWVDTDRVFDTTFELGKYLHEEVFHDVTDPAGLELMTEMWAWISLALIASLLSRSSTRKNKPLDLPHYMELPGQLGRRVGYRLIARTAWKLVRLHGPFAEIALSSRKSPWGEMAEQMTSRQEIFAHPSFWAVAFRLYRGPKGELRRGATSQRPASARKDPKNNAGKGGVRRLPFTFRQFDRTYLTRAMSLEQMLEVLPKEYQRWVAQN